MCITFRLFVLTHRNGAPGNRHENLDNEVAFKLRQTLLHFTAKECGEECFPFCKP